MKKLMRYLLIVAIALLFTTACGKESLSEKEKTKLMEDAEKYISDKYGKKFKADSIENIRTCGGLFGCSPTDNYLINFLDGIVVYYVKDESGFSDNYQVEEITNAIHSEVLTPLLKEIGFEEQDSTEFVKFFYSVHYPSDFLDEEEDEEKVFFKEKYEGNIKEYLVNFNIKVNRFSMPFLHLVSSDMEVAKEKLTYFGEQLNKYFKSGSNIHIKVLDSYEYVGKTKGSPNYDLESEEHVLCNFYFFGSHDNSPLGYSINERK